MINQFQRRESFKNQIFEKILTGEIKANNNRFEPLHVSTRLFASNSYLLTLKWHESLRRE